MSFKQIIERATSESLLSEDWEANLLLSDLLCQRPDEISAAVVQALLNRLQHPNPKVQLLTLTLYDACVKNTTDLFVSFAAKSQNLAVIEHLATQKKNEEVSARATEILGEWEKEQGKKYPQFRSSYAKVTGRAPVSQAASASPAPAPAPVTRPAPAQAAPAPVRSSERSKLPLKEKIRHDLQAVKDQIGILVDLVNAASSVEELKSETSLQVIVNCREMHRRLVVLIEKVPEENLLLELIAINEDLFNAIDYYDQFKRTGKKAKPPTTASSQSQPEAQPAEKKPSSVVDDVFGPPPAATQSTAPTGGVFSLDDLLSAPVVSPTSTAPVASTASSATGAVPLIPAPSYPNPFDYSRDSLQQEFESISKKQEKQPARAVNPFEEMTSLSTEAGFAALAKRKKEEQEEELGFAAIAKKKSTQSNPTNEFEQFLNSKIAPPPQTQQPQQNSSDVFTLE